MLELITKPECCGEHESDIYHFDFVARTFYSRPSWTLSKKLGFLDITDYHMFRTPGFEEVIKTGDKIHILLRGGENKWGGHTPDECIEITIGRVKPMTIVEKKPKNAYEIRLEDAVKIWSSHGDYKKWLVVNDNGINELAKSFTRYYIKDWKKLDQCFCHASAQFGLQYDFRFKPIHKGNLLAQLARQPVASQVNRFRKRSMKGKAKLRCPD
jgi:hypothetical protein